VESTTSLKYQKKQNNNSHLKEAPSLAISPTQREISIDQLKEKVLLICKYQKNYVQKMMNDLLKKSEENALIICDYIIAELNEINLKESTKEGKIKVLSFLLLLHSCWICPPPFLSRLMQLLCLV